MRRNPTFCTRMPRRWAFGAILSQTQEGLERVISYASKATYPSQSKYGSTQLELKAVDWATAHFRHYLLGQPFKLVTDHSALTWLFNTPDLSGLCARWIMRLQEYEIDVTYRAGKILRNVDALSRIPPLKQPYKVKRLPKQGPIEFT